VGPARIRVEQSKIGATGFMGVLVLRATPPGREISAGHTRLADELGARSWRCWPGVSPDYYQHMEQGRDLRPSDQVLDAVARALNLTNEETRHLHNLATAARTPAQPARGTARR
jgi:hypothetical protein